MLTVRLARRWLSSEIAAGEKKLIDQLRKSFPAATEINVEDTSGGCGAFYRIRVVSKEFKGKSILEQHKMVNQALAEEVKKLHGVNIETLAKV